ncbi:iron-sulfur cluster assembly scaffold protein, partial [Candidatus Shapirobacteria bacterium CG_4_9_14_0_2_um_filter_39_11]
SKKVLEHIRHPKNMGEIKNPDGVATVGNPVCGDIMRLFIKVKEGKISDIKFQTLGCGAAIATSSMITTMVKGKPLADVEKITKTAIAEALGGLPPIKTHCSVLAADALHKAIDNYRKNVSKTKK